MVVLWFDRLLHCTCFCFEGTEFSKCVTFLGGSNLCWNYNTPSAYHSWAEAWQLLVPAVLIVFLANRSYESQAEDFVEYLFTDYAVAIESEQREFPTEFRHRLSHECTGFGADSSDSKQDNTERDS